MAFQSLYRRFRPQRFGEVIGQQHLVDALRNAIREDRVGHAYLLSGPRGTGKTSTARILAKALNCENLTDGEPCGECTSCTSIESGTSMDLVELDAASNNRVENIREIIANSALGSPGRRKVYLLDEVHMLSTAASNALLKTLEEPPGHVVFVLATTDPQKVLPTIRSRTQHLELSLVGAGDLADHVRRVGESAELTLDDATVEYVVERGAGSVRDTLSALDQVVAAGGVPDDKVSVAALVDALASGSLDRALVAVAEATSSGVDARDLAERSARQLRDMFLVLTGAAPPQLPAVEQEKLGELGRQMGRAATVRALELIGTALIDMRQAADPRLTLEVALIRLLHAPASTDLAAVVQRVEALERGAPPAAAPSADAPPTTTGATPGEEAAPTAPASPATSAGAAGSPAAQARALLAERRAQPEASTAPPESTIASQPPTPAPPDAPPPPPVSPTEAPATISEPAPAVFETPPPPPPPPVPDRAGPGADTPTVDESSAPAPPVAAVTPPPEAGAATSSEPASSPPPAGELSPAQIEELWERQVLSSVSGRSRAMFGAAEFVGVEGSTAMFRLPNAVHRDRCEQLKPEVEAALSHAMGTPAQLRLVAGEDDLAPDTAAPGASTVPTPEPVVDLDELRDAPPDGRSTVERLQDAFPGATLMEDPGHH